MQIRQVLTTKTFRRCGYGIGILLAVYVLSVGPIVAIGRQFSASPVGPSPALVYLDLFYTPLFAVPALVPLVEFYIGLWQKIV